MTVRALLLAVVAVLGLGCSSSPSRDGSVGDAPVADSPRRERAADAPRAEARPGDGPVAPGCAKGVWCWVNPLPHGNRFNAISMSPSGAIFAVGDAGVAARFDGKSWTTAGTGSPYNLFGVWAFGPDEAIAVGEGGTLLRLGAGKWSLEPAPGGLKTSLYAVWASGPKDIFVVGDKGTVLAHDGTWSVQPFPVTDKPLTGVWGAGPGGDVYAVGGSAAVYRFQRGGSWAL